MIKRVGWCVRYPDKIWCESSSGLIMALSQPTRKAAIERFMHYRHRPWERWYRRGYRCVPLYVKES